MNKVTRLIDSFVPEHYDLQLNIDRRARSFSGVVKVSGISKSGPIRLHSKELVIKKVLVNSKSTDYSFDEQDQLIINSAVPGSQNILVEFEGKITDLMHGMYPCYFKHNGQDKELVATQFESHHAREVFPCVDEPEAKATFSLSLETETEITVLGNMPIIDQQASQDRMVTTFEKTPKMSTYLLAWVYGELQSKSAQTSRGVEVNVWSTPTQNMNSLDFALDVAIRTIDFYEEYFGVKYPLPKSDHVALPDFSSGAMENWGLITYRETALLTHPSTSSTHSKMRVAEVIAHELAHQWFGNLVTMKWWDDLWLNESFANMMEYLVIDSLFPDWDMWLEFATSETVYSQRRDCIDGVQPVRVEVNHPDEISSLFDPAIVYAKGSKLIKMLLGLVGEDAFRKGLQEYFQKHAYKNTVGSDLWQALSHASGKDISKFMNAWLTQPGYPVVSLSQINGELKLSQEQFFVGPHEKSARLWPISLQSSSTALPELLESAAYSSSVDKNDFVMLDTADFGHFITQYDTTAFEKILTMVQNNELSSTQKIRLINDYTLLARSGKFPSEGLIKIILAYKNETIHQVWDAIFLALVELRKFVESDQKAEDKLKELSFNVAEKQFKRLGWVKKKSESENDLLLRPTILAMIAYSGKPEVIDQINKIYEDTPIDELDPEFRAIILSTVSKYGDDLTVDSLMNEYMNTVLPELKGDLCSAITNTQSTTKISELLENLKNTKLIRLQDTSQWYVYLVRGKYSREAAWKWLQNNWDWVIETFGSDKSYDDFPRYSASALSSREQLNSYINFFQPMLKEPALKRVIEVGISEIKGRVELIEKDGPAVRNALFNL